MGALGMLVAAMAMVAVGEGLAKMEQVAAEAIRTLAVAEEM